MEINLTTIVLTMLAGLTSVASPCVFPIIPIIATGTDNDNKFRPLLLVLGLSFSFILMGIVSSVFGHLIAGKILYIEKAAGVIILLFGVLMLFNINLFKNITVLNRFQSRSRGSLSGFFIGFTLGIIWVPCIGPILSGVLAMVASQGKILHGSLMLGLYSIGFSIPILIAGYSSQFFRQRVSGVMKYQHVIRYLSGGILIIFGIYIFKQGLLSFSF